MKTKFHKGALIIGAILGLVGALGMTYFIIEFAFVFEPEAGGQDAVLLVFPAFLLWLIVPVLLAKAFRRGGEEEE